MGEDAKTEGEWLPLQEAAVRLGTSPENLRKRIKRGTLAGDLRQNRWFVFVPADAAPEDAAVEDRADDAVVDALRARLDDKQAEIDRLMEILHRRDGDLERRDAELERRSEEVHRNQVLMQDLQRRIPEARGESWWRRLRLGRSAVSEE